MSEEKEFIDEIVKRLVDEYDMSKATIYNYIKILKDFCEIAYHEDYFVDCLERIVSERSSIYHNDGNDIPYTLKDTFKRAYNEIFGEQLEVSDSMKETLEIEEFEKNNQSFNARLI